MSSPPRPSTNPAVAPQPPVYEFNELRCFSHRR
jgi:hypothetical protein